MEMIDRFDGRYRWLSNMAPIPVWWSGVEWRCAESAYHAAKYRRAEWERFVRLDGFAAKRLSRAIEWDSAWWTVLRRVCVMRSVLRAKFARGSALGLALLRTEDAVLVEGNTWGDEFWGVCAGRGENVLGRLLMDRRAELWMRA